MRASCRIAAAKKSETERGGRCLMLLNPTALLLAAARCASPRHAGGCSCVPRLGAMGDVRPRHHDSSFLRSPIRRPRARSKSLADCTSFDQTDKDDDTVELTIHNSCTIPVDCSISWRVVCAPDSKKRARRARRLVEALTRSRRGTRSAEASAQRSAATTRGRSTRSSGAASRTRTESSAGWPCDAIRSALSAPR